MTDIEDDRVVVEAIRRERGRLTRRELRAKYQLSPQLLDRLVRQYGLAFKADPGGPRYSPEYDRYLARRQ
jgi:hypothetical protein